MMPAHGLALAGFAALLALALVYTLAVLIRQSKAGLSCLQVWIASISSAVLAIIGEQYFLSALPVGRPLAYLVPFHAFALAGTALVMTLRWGRHIWSGPCVETTDVARQFWVSSPWSARLVLLGTGTMLLAYVAWGAFNSPSGWDELAYHLPQAIQPYQDGRILPVLSDLPWAETYPRGVPLLWSWTLWVCGSDVLFHPVNWFFGVQLLLSVAVVARRMGASGAACVLAMGIVATMPLFFVLSTTGYIDLAPAAGVVSFISLVSPPFNAQMLGRKAPYAAAAYAQCVMTKIPIIQTVAAVVVLAGLAMHTGGLWKVLRTTSRWLRSTHGLVTVLIVLAASSHYFWVWIAYGNPIYPLSITLFGRKVFEGPFDPQRLVHAHSTMGAPQAMSAFRRYLAAWIDLTQPLNPDSLGSPGPVFLFVVVFLFALFAVRALLEKEPWGVTIAASAVAAYLVPGAFLPRYSAGILAIACAGAAVSLSRLGQDLAVPGNWVVAALCAWPAASILSEIETGAKWHSGQLGCLSLTRRTSDMVEIQSVGSPQFASPSVIREIRSRSGPGDTLVWNVSTFHGLLWNRSYTNRVVFLPGSGADRYPGGPYLLLEPDPAGLGGWLLRLAEINPRHVLVYVDSIYAKRLGEPQSGYRVAFQDGDERGRWRMALFERVVVASGG